MEKAFSITIKDCDVQFFRASGPGGQNVNKRSTACRISHLPSGAVGVSRKHRTQLENKRAAFKHMAEDPKMTVWINRMLYGYNKAEEKVSQMMKQEQDFRIEIKQDGKWTVTEALDSTTDA
jgi:protein subunit release factor B